MSAASPNMEGQIAELERQTARLKSALSRGAWITRLLLLAFLGFLGLVGYVLWSEYKKLTSEKNVAELKSFAGEAYSKNNKAINENLEKLYKDVLPVAQKVGEEQWKKDQKKLSAKLEAEGKEFQERIQKLAIEKVRKHYEEVLSADLKESLRKEVPELAKDDAKLAKVQDALMTSTYRMVEERLTKRMSEGFGKVSDNWGKLTPSPKRKGSDLSTTWQILGHALEIFYQVGTQPDAIAKLSDAALLRPAAVPAPSPVGAPRTAPTPAPKAGK